jgi:SAM-dependent methyltransferase
LNPEGAVPAYSFLKTTLLNRRSPACLWRHPIQAARVVRGAAGNLLLPFADRHLQSARRTCSVCGWQGFGFRTFLSADEIIPGCICPVCGSFDRHRQLVLGVRDELADRTGVAPRTLIGFSLSSAMRFLLEHEGLARCFRSDVELDDRRFAPDFLTDLRWTALGDQSIDWVFCSHVLEHIPELEPCVDELQRILRPGGVAWIQVPIEPGLTRSRAIPIDPHRAHAHAWQFGPDFGELLARDRWQVTEVHACEQLDAGARRRLGIADEERYWICRKHA